MVPNDVVDALPRPSSSRPPSTEREAERLARWSFSKPVTSSVVAAQLLMVHARITSPTLAHRPLVLMLGVYLTLLAAGGGAAFRFWR